MLGKFKNTLIVASATLITVLAFVGSISATLSWYSYSRHVSMSYHGTSISSNKQLQVGIVTDLDLSEHHLTTDEGVAWAEPGAGLAPIQIKSYLEYEGYAAEELQPITSRKFAEGDNLALYQSPYDYYRDNLDPAEKEHYINIPLAFKVIDVTSGEACENKDIWITETHIEGESNLGFDVSDGIRVFFENENNTFVFNPSAEEDGYTRVAGMLDLNEDSYYDYDEYGKEIVYGDYLGDPTYVNRYEDSDYDDINQTDYTHPYVFLARHKAGKQSVSNFDDLVINTQQYSCLDSIKPQISELNGYYEGGKPVTNTGEGKVGYSTMKIWVEGWDKTCVNQIFNLQFNLDMTFEINKL